MKKILTWSLIVAMMISLMSGCTKKEDDLQSNATATGRYLEEEISLPQEGRLLDIQVLEDGAIGNVMTDDEGAMSLWSTTDYGQTWEKEYDIALEPEEYVSEAILLRNGTMLSYNYQVGDTEMSVIEKIWSIDAQGNRTEIEIDLPEVEHVGGFASSTEVGSEESATIIEGDMDVVVDENMIAEGQIITSGASEDGETPNVIMQSSGDMKDRIMQMQASEAGKIIVSTMMGKILQLDIETKEVLKEYDLPENAFPMGFAVVNEDVYIQTDMGLQCYDIETGDRKGVNEALAEKASVDMNTGGMVFAGENNLVMTSKAGEETGNIYMVDKTGIYRQGEDGTLLEQMVEAGLTSLGMPSVTAKKMLALEDDSLMVFTESGQTGAHNLYRYVYDTDAKTTPETEVRMYTLEDNREIRQAIAMYQKENPDTVVSLQVGMTGDDGTTVSDALNALNTEIMAGNGPDILLLDGMPIDSYIEKGILEDISDVLNKIDEQYGLLKTGENTHAVATRFSVPYIQGEAKYIDMIQNITTMQEMLKAVGDEYPDRQSINVGEVDELMNYLYQIDVNNFITQDGKLEKEKLQNFLEQAKQIAENTYKEEGQEEETHDDNIAIGIMGSEMIMNAMGTTMEIVAKSVSIGRGEIRTQNDLAVILGANEKMNMEYKLLTDDAGENLILTNTILGINSKGEQIEKAKEILEFCLSKEVQKSEQGMGFPVNIEALNETLRKEFEEMGFVMESISDDGTSQVIDLMVNRPEDTNIEAFEQSILEDTRVGYANRVVQEIVVEQLMGYVDGRVSLDEAVEGINQKVSLYLSE